MAFERTMIDDLDGTVVPAGGGGTVQFSFRGDNYELELSQENEEKLAEALAPFMAVARKSRSTSQLSAAVAAPPTTSGRAYEPREARAWLEEHGYDLPARGPVKKELLRVFEEANGYSE